MEHKSLRMAAAVILIITILVCWMIPSDSIARKWHVSYDTLFVDLTDWQKKNPHPWMQTSETALPSLISAVEYQKFYIVLLYSSGFEPNARLLWYDKKTMEAIAMPQPPTSFTGIIVRNDSLILKDSGNNLDMVWETNSDSWKIMHTKGDEVLYEDDEWYVYTHNAYRDDNNVLHAFTESIFRDKATGKEYVYPALLYIKRVGDSFYALYGKALITVDNPRKCDMREWFRPEFIRFYVNERIVTHKELLHDTNTYIIAPFFVRGKIYLIMSSPGGMQICRMTHGKPKDVLSINGKYSSFRFYNSFYYLRANNLHTDEVWTELHDYSSETYAFLSINGYNINLITIQYR